MSDIKKKNSKEKNLILKKERHSEGCCTVIFTQSANIFLLSCTINTTICEVMGREDGVGLLYKRNKLRKYLKNCKRQKKMLIKKIFLSVIKDALKWKIR